MKARLGGWQRIGVVVSIAWFLGFGGFLWISAVNQASSFYEFQFGVCLQVHDGAAASLRPTDNDYREKYEQIESQYKRCKDKATNFFMKQADNNRAGIPILLAIDFGSVVVGWLIVWGMVGILRWVKRGFA